MLGWLSRDGKILLAARPLQSFSASFVSVFFAVYLSIIGLPLWQIGLTLTGGLIASTAFSAFAGLMADRLGRRRLMVFFGLLTALSGVAFAGTTNPVILVSVAIVSTMGSRSSLGPANMLERVILAQSCPGERRTNMYAIRSTLNSVAVSFGSLSTGMVVLLQSLLGQPEIISYRWMFGVYALMNLGTVFLYSMLSDAVETKADEEEISSLSPETRQNVLWLSLLFSVDSLGGGFTTQTLVSYWFFDRFGLKMDAIGLTFALSNVLTAVSFLLAARISERIGLIKTMVFSHIPSSLMIMSVPFMPNVWASIAVYLARSLLCQMDVPTRQSYIMAIVKPEERSRVAGLIDLPRSLTLAVGPTMGAVLMEFLGPSLPFVITGVLKIGYDLTLYNTFRKVKPPEEKGQL